MAIVRDASSPTTSTSGNLTSNGTNSSGTSASFTPPSGSWITITAFVDSTGGALTWSPTTTLAGVSFTSIANQVNASGGGAVAYRGFVANSSTGTISLSVNNGGINGQIDGAFWIDVWTGAAQSQTGAASNSGTSTSANFNGTVTTTLTGSQVVGIGCDDDGSNTPSSTDTFNEANAGSHADGLRAYKASNSGAPGTVNVNFQATTSPVWSWIVFEILPATAWASIASTPHPGRSPGIGGARFYQSPKALNAAVSSNVTVALIGQSATFTAGTLTPNTDTALAGQSSTGTAGTLLPSLAKALSGQTGTFTGGTVTPASAVALAGQTGTLSPGTLTPSLATALSGQSATGSTGVLTPNIALALNGQTATFTAGLLAPSTNAALSGQSGTFTAGLLTPSTDTALSGISALSSAGTVTPSAGGDVVIALTGVTATFTAGVLTPSGADITALPGPLDWPPDRIADTAFRRKKKRRQREIEQPAQPVDPIRVGAIGAIPIPPAKTYDFRSLAELSGKSVEAFRAEIDQEIARLLAEQQERDDEEAITLILAALED